MGLQTKELEPTKENLLSTISKDLLSRNKSVWQFSRLCDAQEARCSIALDAHWGCGKTFFVKHSKMLIESFNSFSNALSSDEKTTIKKAFASYIGKGADAVELIPQVCVYYDAWANDNDVDPILSLIYEITKTTACNYEFKRIPDLLETVSTIFDFFSGKNTCSLANLRDAQDPLLELRKQSEIQDTVKEYLDSILHEQGNRLIVFIDELDRCKPSYAVQLLERIKHYFSNDRITYVFSVNMDELQHTVKKFYGEGFDAYRYLDRFFDYRISLPPANMTRYYEEIGLENSSFAYEEVCRAVIKTFSFELRETEKFYRTAKIAASKYVRTITGGYRETNGLAFAACIVVPIIIGLRMYSSELYTEFLQGKNPAPLLDVLQNGDVARGICYLLYSSHNDFNDSDHDSEKTPLSEVLKAAYEAIFGNKTDNTYGSVTIGRCSFSGITKQQIIELASVISSRADYSM